MYVASLADIRQSVALAARQHKTNEWRSVNVTVNVKNDKMTGAVEVGLLRWLHYFLAPVVWAPAVWATD